MQKGHKNRKVKQSEAGEKTKGCDHRRNAE